MEQIICQNLAIGYDGKVLLQDINFSVKEGDYLCIIGENGSGKSTLMRTMLGLQKPMSGEISLGDGLKKGEIGYLPQQTDVQKNFPASVKEIVLSGCQARALLDRCFQICLNFFSAFFFHQLCVGCRNISSFSMNRDCHAFRFKIVICFLHGKCTDLQFLCHRSHRRQYIIFF